jgi:uncharacterized protein YcfJ
MNDGTDPAFSTLYAVTCLSPKHARETDFMRLLRSAFALAIVVSAGIAPAAAAQQTQPQATPQSYQQAPPQSYQQPPPPPPNSGATIPAGTILTGTISIELSSKSANPGDTFTLTNVATASGDGSVVNATIYGHVVSVQRAGQGKQPQVQLAFDRIVTPDGRSQYISGTVQSMQEKTQSNAKREILGAVVGDIVGNYLGKHIGTDLGGLVGAGGGYLYAKNYKENVTLPQGSSVSIMVTPARQQQTQ